ncbi:hypothetical protein [Nostoc sp.]
MRFVAIAVAIGIDAECHRQAMHIADYAYAPEIYAIKTPTMNSISPN